MGMHNLRLAGSSRRLCNLRTSNIHLGRRSAIGLRFVVLDTTESRDKHHHETNQKIYTSSPLKDGVDHNQNIVFFDIDVLVVHDETSNQQAKSTNDHFVASDFLVIFVELCHGIFLESHRTVDKHNKYSAKTAN